jgi:hypothetical protein
MILETPLPDAPNNEFDRAVKTRLESFCPVKLPVYSYQKLQETSPSLYAGYLVRCSNGNSGGECLAYCDGFNWRVVQVGANISL